MQRWLIAPLALGVFLLGGALGFLMGSEALAAPEPTPTPTQTVRSTETPTSSATPSATPSPTPTATSTDKPTDAPTAIPTNTPGPDFTPSITPTASLTPTYAPIAATVLVQANCRYGPGAAYLYEWGLFPGVRVDIIGRNDLGTWAYVHPWTYFDRCWVKSELLEIRGDLFEAPPYYSRLPFGELYKPPTNVRASRNGDDVTVAWDPVWMTEDDYRGYLIEAWVCQGGQLLFTPVRSDETRFVFQDEPGCNESSGGRLYTAEKHGYTKWVLIPWPEHKPAPTPQL